MTYETYEERMVVLHSPFDLETHKKYFVDYLEVIIDYDGRIMYAVPSHQEKLIDIYCTRKDITREELWEIIPINADVMKWLTLNTSCIAVWNNFYIGLPNKMQLNTLKKFKKEKIYDGEIQEELIEIERPACLEREKIIQNEIQTVNKSYEEIYQDVEELLDKGYSSISIALLTRIPKNKVKIITTKIVRERLDKRVYRTCVQCREIKLLKNFTKCSTAHYGTNNICRDCRYRQIGRERRKRRLEGDSS